MDRALNLSLSVENAFTDEQWLFMERIEMRERPCLLLFFILLFSCIFVPDTCAAEDEDKVRILTLRECIDLAIKNDPDANHAMDQIGIGRLRTKEAKKSLILPRFDLETSYGPKLDYFGRPIVKENIYDSKVSIEKPLYKGGELITNYRLGKSETERARYDHIQKMMDVTADTIETYFRLLSAQENLKYYQELYGQAEKTVDLLNKKFQIGAVVRVDVLEAETKLNEIKYSSIKAQGDLQMAIASLNERIGWDSVVRTSVVKEFPFQPLEGDVGVLIAGALKDRPDFLYEKENLEFNRLRVKLNKSKELPSLSLVGSYSWEGEDFPGEEKEWAVLLMLSFSLYDSTLSSSVSQNQIYENPFNFILEDEDYDVRSARLSIFDGSSNIVNLERAKSECRLVENRLKQLKRAIIKEVGDAVNKLRETEALMETTRKSIEYAEEKLKLMEEKLKLRETTEIDFLDARVELVDAKVKNLQALYQYSVATARLYKAIGKRLGWKENLG